MSFGQLKPIIGGSSVQPHEYPFAIYLSIETQPSWHAVCGGTLISDRHIVTAGHCLIHAPSAQAVKIGYGHTHVKQQEHVRAGRLIVHPQFNPRTLFNDIAIIELETPIRQTTNVYRIPIYFGSVEPGQVLTTMGWGITSNAPGSRTVAVMNRVDLSIADPSNCKKVDESFVSNNGPFICTGTQPDGRDECSGDSGSPAIVTMQSNSPMNQRELYELRQRELSEGSKSWGLLARIGNSGLFANSRRSRRREKQQLRDVRLVALTSYGDNTHHDVHPPCGDPLGFGFSTHIAHYVGFITNATGLSRSVLEAPLRLDRLVSKKNIKCKKNCHII
ncbi:Epidermal growth factor-binding protein type B [Coemansia aciculifera]|uniref:Epidermal growth factor-binding protein type B n=2 Tax=Coemansia TaxID=4863 RepID=A0A9W8GZH7_9FUNG|nr:Epidermal growth factor-binding protein type B [Coemansia pectinata]KAJ2862491.1 Epidermal growth factor-binding protein type B [Coemansia aciculifera]KAJ2872248.1 Epidermal growth factor-binding protein type B [Coemansia aciculifera]KAJ2882819.1 Epidermal growth factor-binding protein type B [Coemansia aciculifera]